MTNKSHEKGEAKMVITATELKMNIGKYLKLANEEDVIITKNGRWIAKLVKPEISETPITDSLRGIASGVNMTHEEIREERLKKRYG